MDKKRSNKNELTSGIAFEEFQSSQLKKEKENYFFKKKFVVDGKKETEKQQILSKLSCLQNYSNPIAFIMKKQQSRSSFSKNPEMSASSKMNPGFSFQNGKKTITVPSKRNNQSLSIKKFSFDKKEAQKLNNPTNTLPKNTKVLKSKSPQKSIFKEVSLNDSIALIEAKLTAILKDGQEGRISPQKARSKMVKILSTVKNAINENNQSQNHVAFFELSDFLSSKLKSSETATKKEKKNMENKITQTQAQDFNMTTFITTFKEFSIELLKEGANAEFRLADLRSFLERKGVQVDQWDFESQKLLKCFCDTIQKQLIFEEVIGILEEENIQIDGFLQMSYERVMQQLISERDDQSSLISEAQSGQISEAKSGHKYTPSKHGLDNVCEESGMEPVKKTGLSINLKGLEQSQHNKTPHGFHQEFIGMAEQFSLSWRKQLEKETQKFKN